MHIILIIILALFGLNNTSAQVIPTYPTSTYENSVYEYLPLYPEVSSSILMSKSREDVIQNNSFYDGLGRLIQMVNRSGSLETSQPNSKADVVVSQVYNQLGLQEYSFLSFPANSEGGNTSINDGKFKYNPNQQLQASLQSIYGSQGESIFYSHNLFESSPEARIRATMPAGNSWTGSNRGTTVNYYFNTILDDVKSFEVISPLSEGGFSSYVLKGSYQPGKLSKSIHTDEMGNQVVEFKDDNNRVVLKKVQINLAIR